MNVKIILSSLIALIIFQACSTSKNTVEQNSIFWVSGFKTEASAGAGTRQVLRIHRGGELDDPQWENFYAPIEGFEFEEGYLQKIEVKEEKLDASEVPADASSIKYTLVKVLDKQKDLRTELNGKWALIRINTNLLNKMIVIPTLMVDLSKMVISGNSGCNNYTGKIRQLSASHIALAPIASTEKMCANRNIEDEFQKALNTINTFQIKDAQLSFYDQDGKEVLAFLKAN